MISQCSCRGTSGYVHEDCLRGWFTSRGEWLDLDCRQCKHPFYGKIGVDLADIAVSRVKDEHGENSIIHALALKNLASASSRSGDYHKAKELLECGLSIEEREYGPDHIEVSGTLNELGNAFGDLGDYQKQKELLERALSIQEQAYGPEHVEVALTLR